MGLLNMFFPNLKYTLSLIFGLNIWGQIGGLALAGLGTEINERERNKGQQHYSWAQQPGTTDLAQSYADWIIPQIGQLGPEYSGQLSYDFPSTLGGAKQNILERFQSPLQSKYYSAEPLQAVKDVALRKAEEGFRGKVIEPLQEQMVKYGISSSYGVDNPVFQAEQDLQTQLGDLGAAYDVQIQNMLQQGEAFEEQARASDLAQAMQLGNLEIPYLKETQFQIPYQDFLRREMFPYETVASTALNYYGLANQKESAMSNAINDWNKFMNMYYAAGTPRGNMAQYLGGQMMGGGGMGGGGMGGGGNMGSLVSGIASMYSDKRLKNIINVIKTLPNGLNLVIYEWNNLAKEKFNLDSNLHIGFIAQEVEKIYPDCIKKVNDYLKIDYNLLLSKNIF
ncbi:MAG: tail fiber domain-containing protein [Candidatus Thorarchaeota archaeon]